ncbi:MAG: phage head morphogenesis protein [Gammaproteobacteria bacterium]|nr:phage head morphogenesis protein [Gammaproteobacteria bacterium]
MTFNLKATRNPGGLSGGPNKPLDKNQRKINTDMTRVFSRQYQEAQRRKIWESMELDWVQSQPWRDEIYQLTHNDIGAFLLEGGSEAQEKIGVSLTDFVDRPLVRDAIRDETYKFANSVGASTKDKLRATLTEANANGEALAQIENRIKRTFGFDAEQGIYVPRTDDDAYEMSNYRAERIARTESIRALNKGEREGYRESGVVQSMLWLASNDACPFCADMDGEECGFDQPFLAQGEEQVLEYAGNKISMKQNYSDVQAPPLHPNCRCTIIAKLVDMYN